ncbi:hypothetical protein DAPPUDRAFT_301139 [Daphnia pulex]|uniref:Uncharacterized protein n=1 Tax=Daphnia pulex TaxID=6669 RepID=E9HGM3_DAPPU|nr:hypothetical protein DAPPUDRAFT_301139 [Daphnia pulex]|eukprot:EFX69111.1 hypothetical protein DAPPUDRAFT_301139 [Daphnia pulex]
MLELDKDSISDGYEIKLLESFSLNIPSLQHDYMKSEIEIKSNLNGGLPTFDCLLPSIDLHHPDEHCDHTYSITSSHSYRQSQHNACLISCCQEAKTNPASIVKTGKLKMKIVNNIPDPSVPKNLLEPEKIQSKVGKKSSKCKDKSMILTFNNYRNTRSRKKPEIVHVIQPTDFCVHCHQELYPNSMKSSVFCLKTGNVLITCFNCSTTMSVKGAFKLPKYL